MVGWIRLNKLRGRVSGYKHRATKKLDMDPLFHLTFSILAGLEDTVFHKPREMVAGEKRRNSNNSLRADNRPGLLRGRGHLLLREKA